MTSLPSWAEFTALIGVIGTGIGGLWAREHKITGLRNDNQKLRDRLATVKSEAEKALSSHEAAMAKKNEELIALTSSYERKIERLEDTVELRNQRIDKLEDDLYMGGHR